LLNSFVILVYLVRAAERKGARRQAAPSLVEAAVPPHLFFEGSAVAPPLVCSDAVDFERDVGCGRASIPLSRPPFISLLVLHSDAEHKKIVLINARRSRTGHGECLLQHVPPLPERSV
jgi:hypothetical protein